MEHSSLLDKLVDKNLLTIKDDKVCVKPQSQYDFTTYPIDEDDCILITFEEYIGLLMHEYMFSEDLTGVIDYVAPEQEETEEEPVEAVDELIKEEQEENNSIEEEIEEEIFTNE